MTKIFFPDSKGQLDKIPPYVVVAEGVDIMHAITQLVIKVIQYMHICTYHINVDPLLFEKKRPKVMIMLLALVAFSVNHLEPVNPSNLHRDHSCMVFNPG